MADKRRARTRRKPIRRINNTTRLKLAGLFWAVLFVLILLIMKITHINATNGTRYSKEVLSQAQQQYVSRVLPAKRGDILDRNGNVLATSNKVYNLVLDCSAVNSETGRDDSGRMTYNYIEPTVNALVQLLGVDDTEVRTLLTDEATKDSQYQILRKGVTMDEKNAWEEFLEIPEQNEKTPEEDQMSEEEQARRYNVRGVWFEETYVRSYPFDSLACDTIGFTASRDEADKGLEGYYNSTLVGVDGRRYGYFNQNSDVEQTIIDPSSGKNLVTTLDVGIQQIVEKYVNAFNEAMGALHIGVIVENPSTGEILAMDGGDRYDLNDPRDLTHLYTEEEIKNMSDAETVEILNGLWSNFCVSNTFEPGSVVKPIVMASALEKGVITENTHFVCDGGQSFGSGESDFIQCWVYPGAHGDETLMDIIAYSCNDGMMQIGALMGREQFIKAQTLFNFGTRTGIDLPNEASGILFEEENLNETELATSTMGQGFNCTMIQEINALCSIINGGYYYQPHVVSAIQDSSGSIVRNINPVLLKQTVATSISTASREYMEACIIQGTGTHAKVQGYSMGGKTGTAEKLPRGNGKYLVSFIGFAPMDNPEVVVYVVIDEANTEQQDNSALPQYVAQGIFSELLPYMNIQPDEIEGYTPQTTLWDGFTGHLRSLDVKVNIDEEGYYSDDQGNRVDSEGNRIDEEGYLLDENGEYQQDENGMPIMTEADIQANMAYASYDADSTENSEQYEDASESSLDNNMESEGLTNEEAGLE